MRERRIRVNLEPVCPRASALAERIRARLTPIHVTAAALGDMCVRPARPLVLRGKVVRP